MRSNISRIVGLYVILLTAVFPLFMLHQYMDIQNDKMNCMLFLTYAAAGLSILSFLWGLMTTHGETRRERLRAFGSEMRERASWPLFFMFIFFVVINVSTLLSDWPYEAFWGNMGRSQGLYMWMVYIVGFVLIALFYEPRRWHLELFVLIGAIISIWGILDYFYLSPIGWQKVVDTYERLDFSSGIGNINALTQVEGVYLLVTAAMWLKERERVRSALYFTISLIHIVALIVAYSDNAIISIACSLAFLPFYAFSDKKGLIRYFALYPGYAFSLFLVSLFAVKPDTPGDMRARRSGILYDFARTHSQWTAYILIGAAVIFLIIWLITRKAPGEGSLYKRARIAWGGVLALAALFGLYLFVDANFLGHADRYASLDNLLILDDTWGTWRGLNWRLAWKYIRGFDLRRLLFGTGLETYALYTYTYDYYTMVNALHAVFDSPHNEWIQMFFTTGILGFVSYYGAFVSTALLSFRISEPGERMIASAFAWGAIAYVLVSFVCVSGPNSIVIGLSALAMAAAYVRKEGTGAS